MRDKILPASRAKLRIHGNGFLQAETRCGNKFHVWDTRLPRQKVPTLIHNHNHGFKSTLLIGDLRWREFSTELYAAGVSLTLDSHLGYATSFKEDLFMTHQCIPREGKDTRLEPTGRLVGLINEREFYLKQGSSYDWPLNMDMYHEVVPVWLYGLYQEQGKPDCKHYERVVTFVTRGEYCVDLPTVLVPTLAQPDNEFDRYQHEDIAVQIYNEAMEHI